MLNGINHLVLKVRDLKQSDHFYREILGLRKVGERGRMWFYTSGRHNHELALMEMANAALPDPRAAGLFHFCFNVPSEAALTAMYERVKKLGVRASEGVNHTMMHSFYLMDPDNNMVEIGVDVPEEEWAGSDPFAADYPYTITRG